MNVDFWCAESAINEEDVSFQKRHRLKNNVLYLHGEFHTSFDHPLYGDILRLFVKCPWKLVPDVVYPAIRGVGRDFRAWCYHGALVTVCSKEVSGIS